jgi:4-hydroxybenzoate polyprenyltransferase
MHGCVTRICAAAIDREVCVKSGASDARAVVAPVAASSAVRDLLQLLRPYQWHKNAVVFAAVIFAKRLFIIHDVAVCTVAFAAFCLVASGAYVMNDLRDCEQDRQHPEKCRRPLPAGRVSRNAAVVLAASLVTVGIAGALALGVGFAGMIAAYFALQIVYTFQLKDVVILDVMAIAAGFVIRAIAGGVVIAVPVSPWLIICTFLGALFLSFGKRRHELVLLEGRATEHRSILREYSPYFLDQMISVVTASTVVAYAIYTASPEVIRKLGTDKLYLTIPFVLFGIFRYLYLVHQREEGGNPTQLLLTDPPLRLNLVLWILTATLLIYAGV